MISKAYKDFYDKLKTDNPEEYKRLIDDRNKQITINYKETASPLWFLNQVHTDMMKLNGDTFMFAQKILKKGKNLTKRQWIVYKLYYVQERDVKDIAIIINISESCAYRLLKRLQKKLH